MNALDKNGDDLIVGKWYSKGTRKRRYWGHSGIYIHYETLTAIKGEILDVALKWFNASAPVEEEEECTEYGEASLDSR
ncbi:hypothetical protein [Listeria booriae]|uniref:hypothetical protein n=1 Tax=Listeria booriae TaxID=1552123 RepID=UPI0016247785|nr:hypothetical protein [Listeria booriae]MBC2676255.1 hypothetical protein [Listeria booriae]